MAYPQEAQKRASAGTSVPQRGQRDAPEPIAPHCSGGGAAVACSDRRVRMPCAAASSSRLARRKAIEARRLGFRGRAAEPSTLPEPQALDPADVVEAEGAGGLRAAGRSRPRRGFRSGDRRLGRLSRSARQVDGERGRPRGDGPHARPVLRTDRRPPSAWSRPSTARHSSVGRGEVRGAIARAPRGAADSAGTASSSPRGTGAPSRRWTRPRRIGSPIGGAPGSRWQRGGRGRSARSLIYSGFIYRRTNDIRPRIGIS